mmetsp:Transcript_48582/g.109438  ORF Transcript_48582/g.109438 Transcript_48582/m.109438 type:complete len:85 (-) Transcript_48582:816-1070(-)
MRSLGLRVAAVAADAFAAFHLAVETSVGALAAFAVAAVIAVSVACLTIAAGFANRDRMLSPEGTPSEGIPLEGIPLEERAGTPL